MYGVKMLNSVANEVLTIDIAVGRRFRQEWVQGTL